MRNDGQNDPLIVGCNGVMILDRRVPGKRATALSITHILSAHLEANFDISETGHPAPDDGIAWWRVTGTIEVTAEAGEL